MGDLLLMSVAHECFAINELTELYAQKQLVSITNYSQVLLKMCRAVVDCMQA